MCLRRRRTLNGNFDLPSTALLDRQNERLSALRSRVLRRLAIARLGPVLDLGCGHGAVVSELVRRSRGPVVPLDRRFRALRSSNKNFCGSFPVAADGLALPFRNCTFDMVHIQQVFLWVQDTLQLAKEVTRVLNPGASLIAIEPDFGGLIEWPESIALGKIWTKALKRSGADPFIGRKLPALLASLGLQTRVDLLNSTSDPDSDRFDLLDGLDLNHEERSLIHVIRKLDKDLPTKSKFIHLPFLFITATKPLYEES